jgi:hypothetical protein
MSTEIVIDPEEHPAVVIQDLLNEVERLNTIVSRLKAERYDLITVAMGAEYALDYPDDNPVLAALTEYESKWGELPAGPKPDEVRDILLNAIAKIRRAQGPRNPEPTE